MSLLIDALKKYRQEATSSLVGAESSVANRISQGLKAKKIVCISLITVIVIALTATISFLVFKHIEKKRITQAVHGKLEQVHKAKALIEEKRGEAAAGSRSPDELRETLKQRMQQKTENQAPTPASAATTTTEEASASNDSSAAAADSSAASVLISSIARMGTTRKSNMSIKGIAATPAKVIEIETHVNW